MDQKMALPYAGLLAIFVSLPSGVATVWGGYVHPTAWVPSDSSGVASDSFYKPEGLPSECDAAGRQTSKNSVPCSNVTVAACSNSAGFDAKKCIWLPCELHHGNCSVALACDMDAAKNVKAPAYISAEKACEANGQKVAEFGDKTIPYYFDKRYKGKIGSAIPNVEPARGMDLTKYAARDSGGCNDQLKIPFKSLVSSLKPEEKQELIATLKSGAQFTSEVQCECDLVLQTTRSYCYCNIQGQKENICSTNTIVKFKGVYDLLNNAIEATRTSCLPPADVAGSSAKAPLGHLYSLGASETNSTAECQKKCDMAVGCNTINVGGGWCYLDSCNDTVRDHTKSGIRLDKGFDILYKSGVVQQAESKFQPAPVLTPAQTQFSAELAAREPCIQGKVLHVPVHPQPTIAELKAEYAAKNALRVIAFAQALEGYRQNENLADQLADDADRLTHKADVMEAYANRKSMSKTLQAQLQAEKPKEKAQLRAKRQLIADKVSKLEAALIDKKPRVKSTWNDIRARVSQIPAVIVTRTLPSIRDGDNYNSSMYPLRLTPKQMLLNEKKEEQAETEAEAIEEKLVAPSPVVAAIEEKAQKRPVVDPKVELNKYADLMHESEGKAPPSGRTIEANFPEPSELM